jgi:hypothetical protein
LQEPVGVRESAQKKTSGDLAIPGYFCIPTQISYRIPVRNLSRFAFDALTYTDPQAPVIIGASFVFDRFEELIGQSSDLDDLADRFSVMRTQYSAQHGISRKDSGTGSPPILSTGSTPSGTTFERPSSDETLSDVVEPPRSDFVFQDHELRMVFTHTSADPDPPIQWMISQLPTGTTAQESHLPSSIEATPDATRLQHQPKETASAWQCTDGWRQDDDFAWALNRDTIESWYQKLHLRRLHDRRVLRYWVA